MRHGARVRCRGSGANRRRGSGGLRSSACWAAQRHRRALRGQYAARVAGQLLIVNQRHTTAVLADYEQHVSGHRPHRTLVRQRRCGSAGTALERHRPGCATREVGRSDRCSAAWNSSSRARARRPDRGAGSAGGPATSRRRRGSGRPRARRRPCAGRHRCDSPPRRRGRRWSPGPTPARTGGPASR